MGDLHEKGELMAISFLWLTTSLLLRQHRVRPHYVQWPGVTAPGHALYGDQGDSILLASTT